MSKKFGTILFSSPDFQNDFKKMSVNNTNSNKPKLTIPVPDSFDGTVAWKDYISAVQDQLSCISCWAFASTFVLESRLAIFTQGKYKYTLSAGKMIFSEHMDLEKIKQHMSKGLAIDFSNHVNEITKCREESLLYANQFLYSYGVPEISCVNDKDKLDNVYSSRNLFGDTYDVCPTNHKEMISHRADGYYYVPGTLSKDNKLIQGNEYNIRRDIYHWGPCSSAMKVFDDFLLWDGKGIYEWDGKSNLIKAHVGHSVAIVGWGTEKGVDYWIIRNSWGSSWGDKGYFKMKRGTNNCEIEENVFVCYPSIPGVRLYLEYPILYHVDDFVIRGLWGVYDNGIKLTTSEKLLLNKKVNVEKTEKAFLYDPKTWVDFSSMIAGNPNTFRYLVKVKESFCQSSSTSSSLENALNNIIMILIIILVLKLFNKL